MQPAKEWLNLMDWLRLLLIFIATLIFNAILGVALLGYSRATGSINWGLGRAKLGELLGDVGNLLIAFIVVVMVVVLAVITIEALFPKAVRYGIYAATVVLALVFKEQITQALTGVSGVAIIAIVAFLFVETMVMYLITNTTHKKVGDGRA